jgi:hypothetical protein
VDTAIAEGGAGSAQPVLWYRHHHATGYHTAAEAIIAAQYVSAGKTQIQAQKEVDSLNTCFETYEVPPESRNHPKDAGLAHLQPAQTPNRE